MAAILGTSKATCHVRSISLPARSHPLTVTVGEQLTKLRSSQPSSSSICNKLSGLKVLYECVDELLQLPLTQQSLSTKCIEDALSGSLTLLEICSTARDAFSMMKELLQELESSFRRRRILGLASEVDAYMMSRKRLTKMIRKCVKNLKTLEKKNKDSNMVGTLREVEDISLEVFESLLSLISKPKASSRSIVSKLLQLKRESRQADDANEVEKVDNEMLALKTKKENNLVQVQKVLKGLEALESSVQEAEEELECIYRQLVKNRVSILNILNNH